jgi:Na+/proline symporter
LKAVVATDAFQVVIMIFGMGAIAVRAFMVAGGVSSAFSVADKDGRLDLFE